MLDGFCRLRQTRLYTNDFRATEQIGRAYVTYFRPAVLNEALRIAADGAVIAAGCTDLLPATDSQSLTASNGAAVLDLTAIPDLQGIARDQKGLTIGACATWSDVIAARLPPAFDGLKAAAREVGGIQIQNAGTVAGNLCNASPAADGAPPLLTLDATLTVASVDGARTLQLSEFLVGPRQTDLQPGEIVTAIHVPARAIDGFSGFSKLGARHSLVISIAMAAVRLSAAHGVVRQAAVAVGACSPVAVRLTAVEDALAGAPLDRDLPNRVNDAMLAQSLNPIDDIRADAEYRMEAAATLVRRLLADLIPAEAPA